MGTDLWLVDLRDVQSTNADLTFRKKRKLRSNSNTPKLTIRILLVRLYGDETLPEHLSFFEMLLQDMCDGYWHSHWKGLEGEEGRFDVPDQPAACFHKHVITVEPLAACGSNVAASEHGSAEVFFARLRYSPRTNRDEIVRRSTYGLQCLYDVTVDEHGATLITERMDKRRGGDTTFTTASYDCRDASQWSVTPVYYSKVKWHISPFSDEALFLIPVVEVAENKAIITQIHARYGNPPYEGGFG